MPVYYKKIILMALINEALIINVLAERVNNKPSLSKYVSEKDNEEEIKYSILSI
jgi:hypothetical protein